MGGRGASSGLSVKGKKYGTEYKTLYQSGNIKFVKYKDGAGKTPMETMTKGRVYATINNKGVVKSITYYDKNGKRYKQIDIDHTHKIDNSPTSPHTHIGYLHSEKGTKYLSLKERKMVDRVIKTWNNRIK